MATYNLTTGIDIVPGTSGDDVVNATSLTLNSGDKLDGGTSGNDTLNLIGSGRFNVSLIPFKSFENITVDSSMGSVSVDLGLSTSNQPLIIRDLSANFDTNTSGTSIISSSGNISVFSGASASTTVGIRSSLGWTGTNIFDGSARANAINGSNFDIIFSGNNGGYYDLTKVTFNAISSVNGFQGTDGSAQGVTFLVNNAVMAAVPEFHNSYGKPGHILLTSDAALDLSHTLVDGFVIKSTNALGTAFTVKTAEMADLIEGGSGQDTITAAGFTFTQAQRAEIFSARSVEFLADSIGTYGKDGSIAPSPPILTAAFQFDSGISATDGITFNSLIKGTTNALAPVSVTVDGGAPYLVYSDTTGQWVFDPIGDEPPFRAEGSHVVVVTANNHGVTTSTALTLTWDITVPTVQSFTFDDAISGETTAKFYINASENIFGVNPTDFILTTTGTATGMISAVSGSETGWLVYVSGISGEGLLGLELSPDNLITDAAGNRVSEFTDSRQLHVFTSDSWPAVKISLSDTNLSLGETSVVTFSFNQEVQKIDWSAVTALHGSLSNFELDNSSSHRTYTAIYTPDLSYAGSDTITFAPRSFENSVGELGTGAQTTLDIDTTSPVADTTAPTVAVTLVDSDLTAGETSHVTFTFTEAVHGFALSDVTASHGQLSDIVTIDSSTFSATFVPQAGYFGTDIITVAAGSYTDIAGNPGGDAHAALTINTLSGFGGPTASGSANSDVLKGTAANDTLFGFEGNDQLDGKGGADKMFGGLGNDTYFVDNAADLVIENADEGNDSVNASVTFTLGANVENLQLSGISKIDGTGNALANDMNGNEADNVLSGLDGRDALRGNGGSDTLDGGTGDDYLSGGAGADILIGGAGGDAMYGGTGADTFRFTNLADFGPATHPDTIGDFNAAEGDIIDLQGVDADIRDGFAGDQAFTFIGSDKFSHSAGELRASGSGGYLTVSGDVNGDGQADFAFIVKAAVLHHSDFIL